MSTGDYKDKLQIVNGLTISEDEEYGIAGRKEDKAFVSKINEALIALYGNGSYAELVSEYGLTESIALTANTTNPYANETDDSWKNIQTKGKFIVGYTEFAPIAYKVDGVLTGFDIELAKAVATYLDVTVEFKLIQWAAKESELNGGSIDLIWNGMTITEERATNMCISVPYLYNKQVAVIRKEDAGKYTTKESMAEAIMTAEGGSAGETVIKGEEE